MSALLGRLLASAAAIALLALSASGWTADGRGGLLVLAHGAHTYSGHAHSGHGHHAPASPWNANVENVAHGLDRRWPTEIAFGMADTQAIQAAVDRLEARGVRDIAVVPLFVSSHSPIIGNSRYILGLQPHLAKTPRLRSLDRVTSSARFRFGGAMDAHPLVSEILLQRALAATDDPSTTGVVLIAHGPNDDEENRLWLRDMASHAHFVKEQGGFRSVTIVTHRNDAPAPVKTQARAELRLQVAEAVHAGTVVVVPLLLSTGGIEAQIEADLSGLAYRFAQPLMPHPNVARWVELQAEALLAEGASPPQ